MGDGAEYVPAGGIAAVLSKVLVDGRRGCLISDPSKRWAIYVGPQGRSGIALCPFHSEETPSFSVDPRADRWHCFGCGWDGDSESFHRAMNAAADAAEAAMRRAMTEQGNGQG